MTRLKTLLLRWIASGLVYNSDWRAFFYVVRSEAGKTYYEDNTQALEDHLHERLADAFKTRADQGSAEDALMRATITLISCVKLSTQWRLGNPAYELAVAEAERALRAPGAPGERARRASHV